MADQYDGLDEATLNDMMGKAENYEERSAIRKALRKFKAGSKKPVGPSAYRRAGWQAPKSVLIPNSVTGNVLPNKVNVTENKVETPKTTATGSYLAGKETPYGSQRRKSSGQPTTSTTALSPRGSTSASPRGSVSSYTSITPEPKELAEPAEAPEIIKTDTIEDSKPRASGTVNVTIGRTPSPQPPAIQTRVAETSRDVTSPSSSRSRYTRRRSPSPPPKEPTPEPEREPTPEPPREPTPEPPREPTPEPPREPTPEPPREPTPEPPRDPTPEPSPSPEPEREPTPEPVREPTPAPPREATPESEEEEEEEEGSEDEEYTDDEESDEDRDLTHKEEHDYRGGRSTYDPKRVGVKTSLPTDVLAKKEDGIDGDFRVKLRKAGETKIDTTKAFPQAKTKGEQVDFRNVLRKTTGPEKKMIKTGGQAQSDFRGSLRGKPNRSPETLPKTRRRRTEPEEEIPAQTDNQQEEEQEEVPTEKEAEPEPEPEQEVEEVGEPEEEEVQEDVQEDEPREQTPPPESEPVEQVDAEQDTKELSFESRQAERRRRRAERMKEMDEMNASKNEEKTPVENGKVENGKVENGAAEDDNSYEARREARRKAREGRLKAASAMVDDKPRLSYRERKALEAKKQMDNAKASRDKWSNREEESGDKADAKPANFKKNTATQQLLAWCQHKTKYYENVEIKDFRQSWSDGLAFCAILHSFLPEKIPYDDLSASDPRKNFTIAFEAAKDAGIPEMLDVDDMCAIKIPDSKSIMTFLVTIYQHFN